MSKRKIQVMQPKYFTKAYNDVTRKPMEEALEYARTINQTAKEGDGNKVRVWAEDIKVGIGNKKFFVASTQYVYELLTEEKEQCSMAFYEHLSDDFGFSRLVADLDVSISVSEDPEPTVRHILDTMMSNIKQDFDIDVDFGNFIVTESRYKYDKEQYSFHVTCPFVIFESMEHQKQWMINKICSVHESVDRSIYSVKRTLRVCYAAKIGTKRYATPIAIRSSTKRTLMPDDYPTDYDFWLASLVKTRDQFHIKTDVNPSKQLSKPGKGTNKLVTTDLSKFFEHEPLAFECLRSSLSSILPSIDWKTERYVPTSYVLDDGTLYIVVSCPSLWRCLVDIEGAKHSCPGKSYVVLSRNGWQTRCYSSHSKRSQVTRYQVDDKGRTCSSLTPFPSNTYRDFLSLLKHLESHNCLQNLKDTITEKPRVIDNPNLTVDDPGREIGHISIPFILEKMNQHHRSQCTLMLDAPTKAGKSGEIRKQIVECFDAFQRNDETQKPRICILVHRKTLGSHTKGTLLQDLPDHLQSQVEYYEDVINLTLPISIVSIESLYKLDTSKVYDLLIMDEYESILPQTLAKTNRQPMITNPIFHWLMTTCRIMIAADAELSEAGVWVLNNCRPDAYTIYHRNTYPTWESTNVVLVPNNARLANVLCNTCTHPDPNQRKNVYATFYRTSDMFDISNLLDVHPLFKDGTLTKQVYDAKHTPKDIKSTHFANVNSHWTNFNLVMSSPVVESGLSFTQAHFQWLFAFFEGAVSVLKYEKLIQMIGRVRNITEDAIFMALDIHTLKTSITLSLYDHNSAEQDLLRERMLSSRSEYPNIDSLYFTAIHKKTKKVQSRRHGVILLIRRLLQMGCSVSLAPWKPPSHVSDFADMLKQIHRSRTDDELSELIASPDINQQNAESLGWQLRFGSGVTKQESLSLQKYYLRKFYRFDGPLSVDWWRTYSPSTVKKSFINLCHLFNYKHVMFDTYLGIFADHERQLRVINQKSLMGAEILSRYRYQELEFTKHALDILKFDLLGWFKSPTEPLPTFDNATFVDMSQRLHTLITNYNKTHRDGILYGPILTDPSKNTSKGLKGLLVPVGRNPSVVIWNLILEPSLGIGITISRKPGSDAKLVLKRPFVFDVNASHPCIRPIPLVTTLTPCAIDDDVIAEL